MTSLSAFSPDGKPATQPQSITVGGAVKALPTDTAISASTGSLPLEAGRGAAADQPTVLMRTAAL
jgi:hypothetical protein